MKLHWSLRLLFAAFGGYVWSLGFTASAFAWFEWIVPGLLVLLSLHASRRLALAAGFFFGAAFHTAALPWIYTVMRVHGNLDPMPAAGVLALLVVYLALYPAGFSLCIALLGKRSLNRALLASPFLWVAFEYAQTHAPFLGFPWNLAGYVAAKNPVLLQLASVTGIYGLSFVMAAGGALIVWAWPAPERPSWKSLRIAIALGVALVLILVTWIGNRSLPLSPSDHVAYLVQTNFPELPAYPPNWMELHAGEMDELDRISVDAVRRSTASAPGGTLIVWPEVPAPFYFQDPKFAARAERIARDSGAHFLAGVVEWRPGPDNRLLPYNSAVLLDLAGQRKFQYDKIHLVPFGEYVPLRRLLKFAGHLVAEVGDYQPGSAYAVGELPGGKFGAFICYEAIFPNEVRQFTANGAELLINLSNDGWYGRSAAPEQHLAMARVRAVENRRWLLRATNNGYTVAIDPYGREVARLAPDIRGVLRAPFSFRSDRTLYSRWGDWFAVACVIASVGFLAVTILKVKRVEERK
ncbi:MAG: apolipoprotein N-acyltransferase [Acidobacteria bacterium]|nr:apolipoprotein N-acyltransferase [Acidobacteriota bacterium]MBI3662438.1 apolipoprotein N-acyltransferase [Acidobacteriota bacterium]